MTVRRRIKTGKLHAVLKEGKYFIPVAAKQSQHSAPAYESAEPTPQRSPSDMVVIKGHPSAHQTITAERRPMAPAPEVAQQNQPPQPSFAPTRNEAPEVRETYIPNSLMQPMEARNTTLVDSKALLAFCEASLRKFTELERRQAEKFKAKFMALETQISHKNMEIDQLRQQVEDLQLLVKIIESKK
jgi:hypothetical protein